MRWAMFVPRRRRADGDAPVAHWKESPGIAGGSSCVPGRLSCQQRPRRQICDLTSAFLILATRNRATRGRYVYLVSRLLLCTLTPDICLNFPCIFPHGVSMRATAPKLPVTESEFYVAQSFIHHQTPHALQRPIKTGNTHLPRYFPQHVDMVRQHPASRTAPAFH